MYVVYADQINFSLLIFMAQPKVIKMAARELADTSEL